MGNSSFTLFNINEKSYVKILGTLSATNHDLERRWKEITHVLEWSLLSLLCKAQAREKNFLKIIKKDVMEQ